MPRTSAKSDRLVYDVDLPVSTRQNKYAQVIDEFMKSGKPYAMYQTSAKTSGVVSGFRNAIKRDAVKGVEVRVINSEPWLVRQKAATTPTRTSAARTARTAPKRTGARTATKR